MYIVVVPTLVRGCRFYVELGTENPLCHPRNLEETLLF